ncbi:MAG: YceI family protein [Acidimicrobiia bacterium]
MTQTQSSAAREIDGRSVPQAGSWAIDPSHSSVAFVARHLMVAKVRGVFSGYDADFTVGERPEDSTLNVTIQAASIGTRDEGRDGHLRSADFLDVERYPTLTFVSSAVRPDGDEWKVDGTLTIRGVGRPATLDVEFNGVATDPWGNERAFFTAGTEFDREDFGLTWNQPLANGGVLVGKKVKVEIEVEAVRVEG